MTTPPSFLRMGLLQGHLDRRQPDTRLLLACSDTTSAESLTDNRCLGVGGQLVVDVGRTLAASSMRLNRAVRGRPTELGSCVTTVAGSFGVARCCARRAG